MEDRLLTELIKEGDEAAFTHLYKKYHKQLYGLAFRYLKSVDMAEDAVQQVFVNLWVNRGQLRDNLSIRNFLFVSLKNHVLNVIRNHRRAIEKNYEIMIQNNYEAVDQEEMEESEKIIILKKANQTLSPQRAQILHMKIVEGLSNQEIAKRLNISINTVKVQYYHTLKTLREYVEKNTSYLIILIFYNIFH